MGKSSINGLFSMAMLNNQRVIHMTCLETKKHKSLDTTKSGFNTFQVLP